MNQSNDVLVAAVYRLLPRKERVLPSRLLIIRLFQLTPISWGYRWAGITEFLQHRTYL